MNAPVALDDTTFDLEAVARELRAADAYARDGHSARTLVRRSDLRIVLVALAAERTISEHHADVTATVQTLSGRIRLQLPAGALELPAGRLLVMEPGLPHDVHAESDSTFLLTLGWPKPA